MSIKPLPNSLGNEIIQAPPVTYEKWSRTQVNGDYQSVNDTVLSMQLAILSPETLQFGGQVLGQYGQSSGKWLAVYSPSITLPPPNIINKAGQGEFVFGISEILPAPTSVPGPGQFGSGGGYGTILSVPADGGLLNLKYRNLENNQAEGQVSTSGLLPQNPSVFNYIAIASDLDNSRFYAGCGSTIDGIVWVLGSPFTGNGGLTLLSKTLYYPCIGIQAMSSTYNVSTTANWGAGALPGYVGSWVPPGYTAWHS